MLKNRNIGAGLLLIGIQRLNWRLYFELKDMNVMGGVTNPAQRTGIGSKKHGLKSWQSLNQVNQVNHVQKVAETE
jgi:hypothetical protein